VLRAFGAEIDLGADDDLLTIRFATNQASRLITTLGPGQDTINLQVASPGFNGASLDLSVTDFEAGFGGDILAIGSVLSELDGFDGASNPFTEFVRFIQDGQNALFQVDQDGIGGSEVFETLLVLENVQASDLISDNIDPNFNPQGGETPGETLIGTPDSETITGGLGSDTIEGRGGNDLLFGEEGNDTIIGGDEFDRINGGLGNDTIFGGGDRDSINGNEGDDFIDGGDGDDIINAGAGADTIIGGIGNDRITAQDEGIKSIAAGDGDDIVNFAGSNVTGGIVDLGAGDDVVTVASRDSQEITLTLGEGTDEVVVNRAERMTPVVTDFEAGVGGDVIVVPFAEDAVGYDGFSNLFAQGYLRLVQIGTDVSVQYDNDAGGTADVFQELLILQNTDAAQLTGDNFDPGFDPNGDPASGEMISGGNPSEQIIGTAGGDTIESGGGNDVVLAGYGNDTITDLVGRNNLRGEAGNDVITGQGVLDGGNDNDVLIGSDFDDILNGGDDSDTLFGGAGNDTLDGGTGIDTLFAGDGDDVLRTSDQDVVDAGAGNDEVLLRRPNEVTVTLGTGTDQLIYQNSFNRTGVSTVTDFETGVGGDVIDFSETLISSDGVSNPFGSGQARLVQRGIDTVLQVAPVESGAGTYSDVIVFQNTLVSDFDASNFTPGLATDGSGVSGQSVTGTNGADSIMGSFGDDVLEGFGGDDQLFGGNGADTLDGGLGADTLDGGFGFDLLSGGEGSDRLIGGDRGDDLAGGDGADVFVFSRTEDGGDLIRDFEAGVDTIELDLAGFGIGTDPSFVLDASPSSGDPTLIYDTMSGELTFDLDGNGLDDPLQLATFDNIPILVLGDFDFV